MKVCCRFAPASGPTTHHHDYALLRLRVEGQPQLPPDTPAVVNTTTTVGTRVYAADPVTLSKASFSCDAVFLPLPSLDVEDVRQQIQQQQQQQADLYALTCRALLLQSSASAAAAAAQRRIYLAYGQTASGKTYSLFGDAASSLDRAEDLHPTAGVVPRFLFDVFHSSSAPPRGRHHHHSGSRTAFVDVSCFEVYNEVTTDLVALACTLAASASSPRSTSTATASGRHGSGSATAADAASVWAACELFHAAQENLDDTSSGRDGSCGGGASPFLKTAYKATEKQQVLRCVERARCGSFADAQIVLRALLTLRQACATSRNQSSSRGHLIVRVEAYAAACGGVGWALQHETAFVDLAGSESGRLAEADPQPSASPRTLPDATGSAERQHGRPCRGRSSGPVTGYGSRTAGSRASSQHSRTSHDTSDLSVTSSQQSNGSGNGGRVSAYHHHLLHPPSAEDDKARRVRRQRETRCINASLLALRKVFRALYEATAHLGNHNNASNMVVNGAQKSRQQRQQHRPPLHHAPFKDSALTAILEPFFIPQVATLPAPPPVERGVVDEAPELSVHVVLLVCCSSRSDDFYESVATLRLGAEATAVNPEVVLRALPVQRREQQQRQQRSEYGAAGLAGSGVRYAAKGSIGGSLQPLVRSASAPSQRMLQNQQQHQQQQSAADVASVEAPRRRSTVAAVAPPPSVDAAEVARLKAEVLRYKNVAQQLYTQCKSLCTSYDECVDELGRCRAALAAKDVQVAALTAQLAAAAAAPAAAPAATSVQTPIATTHCSDEQQVGVSGGATRLTTITTAPAAAAAGTPTRVGGEGSSSPAARSPGSASPTHRTQQQQSQQYARFGRVLRPSLGAPEADVGCTAAQQNAAPLLPGAPSRLQRCVSVSAAREDSARYLVSVSPFSTASVVAGSVTRQAAEGEEEEERDDGDDDDDDGGVWSSTRKGERASRTEEEPARTDPSLPSTFSRTDDAPASLALSLPLPEQQQQQQQERSKEKAKARSIMDTLLARQVFPAATLSTITTTTAAATPSSARAGSPSPLLPALSAHLARSASTSPPTAAAAAAAQRSVSCRRTQSSPSSSTLVGSGGATASSTATSEAAKRSPSGNEDTTKRGENEEGLQAAAASHSSPTRCGAVGGSGSSGHRRTVLSPEREHDDHAEEDDEEGDVEEVIISFRGSPAAHAATASEGSTRRSKSTVYTALMPPSPSRSPASSRSPTPPSHESMLHRGGVYRL